MLKLPRIIKLYRVAIVNGNAEELIRLNRLEYDDRFPEAISSPDKGEPIWYTRFGNNIELYPVPEKDYTVYVRFMGYPNKLVEDIDETVIPYSNLVISASTVKAFSTLTMPEEASYWHQIYQSELRTIRKAERRVDSDSVARLEGFSTRKQKVRYVDDPRTVI